MDAQVQALTEKVLNKERLARLMDEAGIDVLIASTPENVLYLTSMFSLSHWFIAGVECYAVLSRDDLDTPALIYPIGDSDLVVESGVHDLPLFPYGQFFVLPPQDDRLGTRLERDEVALGELAQGKPAASPADALSAALASLERPSHIGFDSGAFSEGAEAVLRAYAARVGARVTAEGGHLLLSTRMVKTPVEIARLTYAARVTEDAMQYVLENVQEGISEIEARVLFQEYLVRQGVEPRLTVLTFGGHSAFPSGLPGERRLKVGDIIRFDVGGIYRHYWSDLSRCAVYGEGSPRLQSYYRALLLGEDACMAAAKPGATAASVFDAAMEVVKSEGIPHYRRQHVGHGIGLNVYDPPVLKAGNDTVLEPGMVLNVETPYYEIGLGGLQVEDLIVITEKGCEMLTRTDRELRIV